MTSVFLFSLLLILLGVAAKAGLRGFTIPTVWLENAQAAFPAEGAINPLELSGVLTSAGAFFGLAAGAMWLFAHGGFAARGALWQRVLRYLIGLIGVLVLWYGLGAVFPRGEYLLAYVLRYLRYALVGVWMSALAPLVFIRLRLAGGT